MTKKVAVIGGGIVGCITSLFLIEKGYEVTLLDQSAIGQEASWAGAGILSPLLPWNYQDAVNNLCFGSADFYHQLSEILKKDTGIDSEWIESGMLIYDINDKENAIRWCQKNDIEIQQVQIEKTPYLFLPHVAQIRNPRLLKALKIFLIKKNVVMMEHQKVSPIIDSNNFIRCLQTESDLNLEADYYVVASGAWSSYVLNEIDIPKIKPIRGQLIQYPAIQEKLPYIIYKDDFYLVQRQDGVILAGSTKEDVGFDKGITDEARHSLQQKAEHLMPALKNYSIENQWSGLRPGSEGNVPMIEKHHRYNNVYLNIGHYRYGLTMAPKAARIISDLITLNG
ncbi:MAG: NAD(P)/FAD-dependent oxidoreductase [Candidatus Methylopumilus sp.]|jgi:glycine oxidase|nr:FAD-dependent oxidoreductase [Betaproteobacteria bacterium]